MVIIPTISWGWWREVSIPAPEELLHCQGCDKLRQSYMSHTWMHHITTYVSHHLSNVTYTVLSKHSGCDQLSFNVETVNFQCGRTISNKFHFFKAVVGLLFREHPMVFPCCWVPGQMMKPRTHGWLEVEREAVSKSKTERWRPSPRMGKMRSSLRMGER